MELVNNIKITKILKITLLIFVGTIFLALSSKFKIPFYPVPMTMQTFVVLFLGVAFGWKIAFGTICLYLFEGAVGLPVFSGTPEKGVGFTYMLGPTAGYLFGFLIAALVAGVFNYDDIFKKNFFYFLLNYIKLLFSVSFIYLFGLLWLGSLIGWDKPIFDLGAKPFLIAESFKVLILSLVCGKVYKLRNLSR
ncbi:MAG: BioY family transporter [Pelagibacteraceae bacterium TMED216]|nr:MAG: BioY family transporter [Pelagibacteraceae bacterium TMED216]|tara:strand:- start:3756 stop:4331 length:576 start_codon:yes stop_codon:yes gene_type:complete